MIVEVIIEDRFIERKSDTEGMILHKIGTDEYYTSALDLLTSPYQYEEVEDPDYRKDDSDSDVED